MAPLNGLVLAGGKSVRMGQDKASLPWHGKPQHHYMADLLGNFCQDVFISVRAEPEADPSLPYRYLADRFPGKAQYGAILTALQFNPAAAWLVVACDLPLLDRETLDYLVRHRNPLALATSLESPADRLPEPLVCIWEPRSREVLLERMAQGFTCPRKVLLNSQPVHIIQAPDGEALLNVNTPREAELATGILIKRQSATHG